MKRYARSTKKGEPPFRRTALFFKEESLDNLQMLSVETGAPVAELVRRAVDSMLDSRKDEIEHAKERLKKPDKK